MRKITYIMLMFLIISLFLTVKKTYALSPMTPPMCRIYGIVINNDLFITQKDDVAVLILYSGFKDSTKEYIYQNTTFLPCRKLYPSGKIITTDLRYQDMRERNFVKKNLAAYIGKLVAIDGFNGDSNQISNNISLRTEQLLAVLNIILFFSYFYIIILVIRFLLSLKNRKNKLLHTKKLAK